MNRRENGRQLNNAGFSLLELLIAVIILAVIVAPLLNSFLVSIKTNAKAERTMDATAIAESIMEDFEAYTIEEMKTFYEKAGYTIEETPESNPDGKWVFVGKDTDTLGRIYEVEITLDPSGYHGSPTDPKINDKQLADIQNLVGSMNAVFSEKKDAETEAVKVFQGNTDSDKKDLIPEAVDRIINVKISKNSSSVDLGGGETQAVETYLVTAESYYKYTGPYLYTGESDVYPESSNEYIIFSNKEAVKNKAAEIKEKKAAGIPLDETDVVESKLANVVINIRPRFDGSKTIITVENEGNVPTNLYLVEQDITPPVGSKGYKVEFNLVEKCESGWNQVGKVESTKSAATMRTNFPTSSYVTYKFKDMDKGAITGESVTGTNAINIMQLKDLTPTYSYDRMYDITVEVYEDGARGTDSPWVTMTGTVTN